MSRRRQSPKNHAFAYSKIQELMASPTEPPDVATRTQHLLRIYRGLSQLEEADKPTFEDWLACSEAINVTEALIEMGVANDVTGLLGKAAEALANVAWAGADRITTRLEGAGRDAVREIVDCYADILAQLPARTIITAHRHSERRQRERLASMATNKPTAAVELA